MSELDVMLDRRLTSELDSLASLYANYEANI